MKKITMILGAALVSTAMAGSAMASGKVSEEQRAQVTQKLTAEGYDVRKVDMEDGQLEVYALKDGKKVELYLDAELNVVRTKSKD